MIFREADNATLFDESLVLPVACGRVWIALSREGAQP
jgi:hypothetical protein